MSIDELRRRILDSQSLPYTHQIINVRKFLKDNEQFLDTLLTKAQTQRQSSRTVKSKSVSKFLLPKNTNISHANLKQRNQYLQKQLKKLSEQENEKQFQQSPQLFDKQSEISELAKEVETLSLVNSDLKKVLEGDSDMFELYEKMCRRCEGVRKVNDDMSQELKNCIKKINELTGRDDNPNLFIMNFK